MDFCVRVPVELRMGKRLYDVFLRSTLFKEFHLLYPEMEKTKCRFERFVDPRYGRYHLKDFFQCSTFYQKEFGRSLKALACVNLSSLGAYISILEVSRKKWIFEQR